MLRSRLVSGEFIRLITSVYASRWNFGVLHARRYDKTQMKIMKPGVFPDSHLIVKVLPDAEQGV